MASGKNSRIDNKRSSSSCSAVILVVFVALCLVGVWMMTSTSVFSVDVSNSDVKEEVTIKGSREEVTVNDKRFEDDSGDATEDVAKEETTKSDSTVSKYKGDGTNGVKNMPEMKVEKKEQETQERNPGKESEGGKDGWEDPTKRNAYIDENGKTNEGEDSNKVGGEVSSAGEGDDNISEPIEAGNNKQQKNEDEKKLVDENKAKENVSNEEFPDPTQSELLNETNTQNGAWSTQAVESRKEKEAQLSSNGEIVGYIWKLCNVSAGPDYIPCLDNKEAILKLRSTKHYEHRERHCPEEGPTCLVPLPEGYKRQVKWPKSRDKIWYANVPHAKLAEVKGHQNWVKASGEYLTFPGGGTQFKHGALHYIDFIKESVPKIAWGERIRVVLDVGCGVASFGGFLFDRDVLTMSFAPKDEHEAQVQFALERGIPAISAVMGTKRLPFPGNVFDIVHCARCRVPWHIEDGMLLLELNRLLRPGGYFVWSATPVYQDLPEDVKIWKAMSRLTRSICWEMVSMTKDSVNGVGVAIYRKPLTNECYDKRVENDPPLCKSSDDPNAAWNVPLQACLHSIPVEPTTRGSQWPEQWPKRLDAPPYWLNNSRIGVYGQVAPEDFKADSEHWKRVVNKSFVNGMGINWPIVRNVMDMRAVYGGLAAAMRDMKVWVMNVVSIDSADTLPVIYERGLFGIYHDWCQSFSSYPRTYDLMHADHLFSRIRKRCKLLPVMAEVDRLLRPEGNLIVRDNLETIEMVKNIAKSLRLVVRMSYSKENQGLLCLQKTTWRPKEVDTSM